MLKSFRGTHEGTSSQTEIKKSIFFCHLKMTLSVEEADAFIKQMKKEYRGWTNASAYIVGASGEHQRARDNGEPSGTAGLPILEALKQHDLVNMTAVVSRKWGGTLLGANRLKIAYGGACNKAIRELGLAEWRLQQEIHLVVDYHFTGLLENELKNTDWIQLQDSQYGEKVTYICSTDLDDVDQFMEETTNWTNGQAEYQMGEKQFVSFPVSE